MGKFVEKLEIFITLSACIVVGVITIIQGYITLPTMLIRFIVIGLTSYIMGLALKFYIIGIIPDNISEEPKPEDLLEAEQVNENEQINHNESEEDVSIESEGMVQNNTSYKDDFLEEQY